MDLAKLMREEGAFVVIELDHAQGDFRASLLKNDSRSFHQSYLMIDGRNVTERSSIPELAAAGLFAKIKEKK